MPPAIFIDKVAGTGAGVSNQTFVPPLDTKPGDVQIVVIPSEFDDVTLSPESVQTIEGWEEFANIHLGATGCVFVARRIARADDPSSFKIFIQGGGPLVGSSMLVYRDLNPSATVVEAGGATTVTTQNHVCPSRTLAKYSDLYIGIVAITSNAVAITHPAGTNERHDFSPKAGKQLEIFDLLPEAAGPTGTKTATTAANQSGMVASLAIAANGLRGFGKTISGLAPVPGMIGLPTKGV